MKATSAVSGPNDPIIMPRGSRKPDWEVELAFVVGEECRYADEAQAAASIAGCFVCNDVSERAFQLERGGQWEKGKGCDSFGPIGPWLVTADEVRDPCNLRMWPDVNGRRFQDSSTNMMIFSPASSWNWESRVSEPRDKPSCPPSSCQDQSTRKSASSSALSWKGCPHGSG